MLAKMTTEHMPKLQFFLFAAIAATLWQVIVCQNLPAIAEIYHDTGTVREGEETQLFCLVSNIQPNDLVQFSHNNRTLTENSLVIVPDDESLYQVLRVDSRTFTRFYFTLATTSRNDNGQYGCHILASRQNRTIVSSSFVSLSVFYLPRDSHPICHSEPNTDSLSFLEGDHVTLSCLSAGGNPPISLTWEGLGQSTTISSSTTVSAEGLMTNQLTLQPQDGTILTCRLNFDNEIFSDATPRSCSIGPFSILPRPVVTLQPLHVKADVRSTAQFECVVKDIPENARVYREWSTSPSIPANRFFLSIDKTIALIQDVNEADNKTIVTCRASTILASMEASGMLTVLLKDSTASTPASWETVTPAVSNKTLPQTSMSQNDSRPTEGVPQRTTIYYTSSTPSSSIESSSQRTSHFSSDKEHVTYVNGNEMGRLGIAEALSACNVVDNYRPYIVAIVAAITVSLIAVIVDILLVLKLIRPAQMKTVPQFT